MNAEPFTIAAGPFGHWLKQMRASLRGADGTDVPCGDCVGCCVSSYYIPLRLQDHAARSLVPPKFLVEAGVAPQRRTLIGYLPDGTCPMLSGGQCSIYTQRPQTCRDYDCRIFAAAGIEAGAGKSVINRRVHAWRFDYRSDAERQAHAAVRAAARFVQTHGTQFPGRVPAAPTGIAVLAIKSYEVFLDPQVESRPVEEVARAVIEASRVFDASEVAFRNFT